MRYRKDHKQQTNQRILRAAGRLFRKPDYTATGVDAVMKSAAYLTAGGFYSQFSLERGAIGGNAGCNLSRGERRPSSRVKRKARSGCGAFTSFRLIAEHRKLPTAAAQYRRLPRRSPGLGKNARGI